MMGELGFALVAVGVGFASALGGILYVKVLERRERKK
jgi:hypothetical protein